MDFSKLLTYYGWYENIIFMYKRFTFPADIYIIKRFFFVGWDFQAWFCS